MNSHKKTIRQRLVWLFAGTLKRQLIFGVALVHAVMMALFVWDLTVRQQELLLERQTEQAEALARSVATSSAGWVAARDLYGLQEIITSQSRYPELLFAMILDKDGRILAHTDTARPGQYVKDLPGVIGDKIISRSPALVDAVSPVVLADQPIGWARIGLGQKLVAERLAIITRDGVIYALVAIVIGSILAWVMATRLTSRLRKIEETAEFVESGDTSHRVAISGNDEVSHVAHAFNEMLDSMVASRNELEMSEERFNLAMLATSDGLWDWDLETNDVYFSPRWKGMLGYEEHELENNIKAWEKLVDPDDRDATMNLIKQAIEQGKSGFATEFRLRHKQGHWMNILSRGLFVRNKSGEPHRVVGTHVDLTQRKQMENELREHRDRLETIVAERTTELVQAKVSAEKANTEKSQFLANMSHELRTPMHAIVSFTELALKREQDEKNIRFLNNIKTSARRLTLLLNDLLDMSKLEAGKMDVTFKQHDIMGLLSQSVEEVRSLAGDKNITIDIDAEAEVSAEVDEKLFAQLINNLLSNAIKFNPENGVVRISLKIEPEILHHSEMPFLEVIITDHGVGIPVNELESVFDKFVQSSKTTTNAGGTGLGLPICREIIDVHHGDIWAVSPVTEGLLPGTEIHFRIPVHQQETRKLANV